MPRYKLTIAYDGTDFCGWQKQEPLLEHAQHTGSMKHIESSLTPGSPGRVALRTVQAVVEKAVREVVREEIILFGASRTDSGVHAKGQVAAFTTTDDPGRIARGSGWPIDRGVEPLLRAINGRLPDDVLITAAQLVAPPFDPVGDCTSKGYSYTIHASRTRPLWDRRHVHQVWEPLDLALMQRAADLIVGEH
ncbi:MAG TPA: tRNA pseudouridine synthase A, partial [Phycisphaerales bacterium]|nr:tRNA pseudouridine synthase A [Phycisphaerales bacterium]